MDNRDQFVQHNMFGSRAETATVLVGTARSNDLVVRHHVASTMGGYWISNALADLVFDEAEAESDAEPEPEPEKSGKRTTKKTSGTKAAKTVSQEGE